MGLGVSLNNTEVLHRRYHGDHATFLCAKPVWACQKRGCGPRMWACQKRGTRWVCPQDVCMHEYMCVYCVMGHVYSAMVSNIFCK